MGFTAQVVSLVSCGIRDRSSVLMGGGGRGCWPKNIENLVVEREQFGSRDFHLFNKPWSEVISRDWGWGRVEEKTWEYCGQKIRQETVPKWYDTKSRDWRGNPRAQSRPVFSTGVWNDWQSGGWTNGGLHRGDLGWAALQIGRLGQDDSKSRSTRLGIRTWCGDLAPSCPLGGLPAHAFLRFNFSHLENGKNGTCCLHLTEPMGRLCGLLSICTPSPHRPTHTPDPFSPFPALFYALGGWSQWTAIPGCFALQLPFGLRQAEAPAADGRGLALILAMPCSPAATASNR